MTQHSPHPHPFFSAPKGDKDDPKKGKKETVRTQMMGESPGDDLGYDPATIPVEDIPSEED